MSDMKRFRLPILMAVVTMLTLAMSSCSSDDDTSISVNFILQDESGCEKYIFKEGENIIFKLDITNNTEEPANLPNMSDMFNKEFFHVISSKGEDYGYPYDCFYIDNCLGPFMLPANYTYTFLCPWINNPDFELPWEQPPFCYFNFFSIEKFRPLPKGEYYSKTSIRLDKKRIVSFKKSFIIE